MKIYPDTKVYILCPANIRTGGPELLHQLCSTLIQFGIDACMLYHALNNFHVENPVDDFYKKYHLPYTSDVVDDARNILVVYESFPLDLYLIKNVRRVFWWLSVDNYLRAVVGSAVLIVDSMKDNTLQHPLPKFFYFSGDDADVEHWVQSEYARQFVKLNGIHEDKIHFVSDYLNQEFLQKAASVDLTHKENWVAFNPVKGAEITKTLIENAPEIIWAPIKNMTPAQVQSLLAKCKVYIDFGHHPGKDRIPREAAICGCVVITGKRGAAANDVDVEIPAEFKFDDKNFDSAQVIDKIKNIFDNFDVEYRKQESYRRKILVEKNIFVEEVAAVCEISSAPVKTVAIFDLNEYSVAAAQTLLKNDSEFVPAFIVDDVLAEIVPDAKIDFFTREQNRNFLNIDENHRMEIISTADAKFLFAEGRIQYLAVFDEDIKIAKEIFHAADNRILDLR